MRIYNIPITTAERLVAAKKALKVIDCKSGSSKYYLRPQPELPYRPGQYADGGFVPLGPKDFPSAPKQP